MEIVFRAFYHYSRAVQRGESDDLVSFLAEHAKLLGISNAGAISTTAPATGVHHLEILKLRPVPTPHTDSSPMPPDHMAALRVSTANRVKLLGPHPTRL